MKTSSVFVSSGRLCRPFLFEKSGILWANEGVSGIVFTGEGEQSKHSKCGHTCEFWF